MLSENAKKLIRRLVEEQYNDLYKEKKSVSLDTKINNFSKFLELFENNCKYHNDICGFTEEIERVVSNNERSNATRKNCNFKRDYKYCFRSEKREN